MPIAVYVNIVSWTVYNPISCGFTAQMHTHGALNCSDMVPEQRYSVKPATHQLDSVFVPSLLIRLQSVKGRTKNIRLKPFILWEPTKLPLVVRTKSLYLRIYGTLDIRCYGFCYAWDSVLLMIRDKEPSSNRATGENSCWHFYHVRLKKHDGITD